MPNPTTHGANEWVEIANDADTPADLSGWMIDDADGGGSPYHLPQGSSISPHGLLVITLPKALFNNGGDTVRLLRPDNGVADQYIYPQSSADQSFCRAERGWKLCDPSPNAPNQAAVPLDTLMAASSTVVTQTPNQAPSLHAQSVEGDSSSMLSPFVGSQGAITAAPAYANATTGALYRGVARTTPITSFNMPTPMPSTQHTDAPQVVRPTGLSLGMAVGMFLFAVGGAISGYDWLRTRRRPSLPVSANDELLEVLDGELLEDE